MLDFGFYNMDCMEGMKEFPDKYFDLAVVDPPYGDAGGGNGIKTQGLANDLTGISSHPVNHAWGGDSADTTSMEPIRGMVRQVQTISRTGGKWAAKFGKKIISWDHAPGDEYFKELFRVSKNQIIFGGNYFGLPPNRCFIIWRKTNIPENFSMAMVEYAWCSFNDNAKMFSCNSQGQKGRFHPTQKPVELYDWILNKYAHKGDLILDTHVGGGRAA